MRKTPVTFTFTYPLKQKVVRNLRIVTDHVGDLQVEGVGYFNPNASVLDIFDRYTVDIEYIKWNGMDIKSVIEVTGGFEEIHEAAVREFANQFQSIYQNAA